MYKQRGVTLLEMLTVIAIIGILAAIALPAYSSYSRKAKRADAKVGLTTAAQTLERCYTRFNSYSPTAPNPACISLPVSTSNGAYTIDLDTAAGGITANTYYLKATPVGSQAKDTYCGTFKLNYLNVQSVSSGATDCW